MDLLELRARSRMTYPTNLKLELGKLEMRHSSEVEAKIVHVKSTFLFVEGGAVINTSGKGPDFEMGHQPGAVTVGSTGTGAGHGGYGGGADVLNFTTGRFLSGTYVST